MKRQIYLEEHYIKLIIACLTEAQAGMVKTPFLNYQHRIACRYTSSEIDKIILILKKAIWKNETE